MFNVFFAQENVLSLMGREAFVGTEKTKEEHYTLWSMGGRPAVVDIGPIEKAPLYHFILDILDYALPVQVAI